MATYAVGDVQGCFDELRRLLDLLEFDPAQDRLWFTGDLVNRGPQSLATLRFVRGLGSAGVSVLGNHDLHLLAAAAGHRAAHPEDTLEEVMLAPDREDLLGWLRRRPLLHHDASMDRTLIHAGLPPQWDLPLARSCAAEVEAALRSPGYTRLLAHMYGGKPQVWSEELKSWDRLRFIINCFTRLRFCDTDGRLYLKCAGPPGSQPAPYAPWFEAAGRASADMNIVFGHWSALGFHRAPGVTALDTGCLWGGRLTALRLDRREQPVSVPCRAKRPLV